MKKAGFILVLLLSFFTIALAQVQSDIEYGKVGDETLLLDVSSPNGDGPFPIALIVHGGGWTRGDKQGDEKVLFGPLTDANFVWFSINYRLAPKNRWPGCFEDVKTAVKWVKANAGKYKGDPNRIAIFGYSAGGQLASLAAVTADKDTAVQALVGLAPPTDLVFDSLRRGNVSTYLRDLFGLQGPDVNTPSTVQILWDCSPINHLKSGLPPVLLVHGTADKSVPYQLSLNFKARLDAFGVPCEIITIKGAQHRIADWNKYDSDFTKKIIDWLNKTLSKK
ncbi:MAG: alpha/beta hydrolase [Planctomycetaceae bacterium]|nr:MAG: alpha/beta hydrolase [Planctomycetaceae bacterium]